nr:glutathione peroxidase 2 [Dunaliella salina]
MRTLDEFRGKVVIVTNVASKCGFTDANYKGLQATYEKYSAYGLEILAFPCDQFGHQEPGTEEEISQFCSENYKVTFPLFSKVDVNGPNTHPVFQFLKAKLPKQKGGGSDIGWNFFKFIIDKRGNPTRLFPQTYDVARVEQEVYRLLTLPL